MGKAKSIKSTVRAQIVTYHENGRSERYIANTFNVSKTAVHQAIVKYREVKSFSDRPRSGAPKKTTLRDNRLIRREVQNQPFISSNSVS